MTRIGVRDVARRALVSPGTVSNFLNYPDKVASHTAARIQLAIRELGYVGNSAARTLRVGESQTLAHIAVEVNNPFFFDFADGVESRAAEAGFSVLIANSAASVDRQSGYFDLFEAQRVRGIILSPIGNVRARVQSLRERGIPVVLIDRNADEELCSSVAVDDMVGGEMAVGHLLKTGRKRILFVGGPMGIETVADRLAGARRAVLADPVAQLEIIDVDERTIAKGREVGRELLTRPIGGLPTGIFAANDLLAVGIQHSLLEKEGLRIPEDIAIVGYDDIDFAANAMIPLTTVRRPGALFGRTAVDLLLQEIAIGPEAKHESVTFQPSLVVRRSTSV